MEEEIIQKLKSGRKVQMTEVERSRMRSYLTAHIKGISLNEVPEIQSVTPADRAVLSPYMRTWGSTVFVRIIASALMLVLITGTGVTFASADATPGSPLYPIRVQVKEKVERALLRAPEKKLAYDKARLESRITELETLAESDTSDEETVAVAKAAFSDNLSSFEETLDESEHSGRVAIASETKEAVLLRLSKYDENNQPPIQAAKMAPTLMMSAMSTIEAKVETAASTEEKSNETVGTESADQSTIAVTKKNTAKESIRDLLKTTRVRILERAVIEQETNTPANQEQISDEDTTETSSANTEEVTPSSMQNNSETKEEQESQASTKQSNDTQINTSNNTTQASTNIKESLRVNIPNTEIQAAVGASILKR